MAEGQVYNPAAFEKTSQLKARITEVANLLGLSPEAIYGAMVEENHSYQQGYLKNIAGDVWTLSNAKSHASLLSNYLLAREQNKLDNHSTWDKFNPVLNDIGPYNYKLGTAIRFLQEYLRNTAPNEDPLNLKRYSANYSNLAHDLATGDVTPEFAGLMLVEAKRYMQQHADPEYWRTRDQVEKDAIYLTYYNMGPVAIEAKRPLNMQDNQGVYKPRAGKNAAAGEDHLKNATQIGQIFGHPAYRTPEISSTNSAPPASTTETALQPDTGPVRTLRAPSSSFVHYHSPLSAELYPGGTLSDIVAIERARGNRIALGDLRAANGLDGMQDARLRPGYQLLVPQKHGDLLQAEDDKTRLSLNPADGSFSLRFTAADGSVMRCERRWNASLSRFQDLYEFTDTTGSTHQTREAVNAGYGARFSAAYQPVACQRIAVESSNIASIGYAGANRTLSVLFLNGGLYEYYNVPRACFDAFLSAPSKGRFLHEFVKGAYPYARIGASPWRPVAAGAAQE